MAQTKRRALELPPAALLLALLPLAVMAISFVLVFFFGHPSDHLARPLVHDGHAETAGRYKTFATWVLLFALGIASLAYFFWNFRLLGSRIRWWIAGVFALVSIVGLGVMAYEPVEGTETIGRAVICGAFARPPAHAVSEAETRDGFQIYRVQPNIELKAGPPTCANPDYRLLWILNRIQRMLLPLFCAALVLGTISCLAMPVRATPADCRLQVRRLKTHLYLTAAVFVAGLLFLSAALHWPAFAFRGVAAASYAAHVNAFVLFWGVIYTVFIASYYVPVALFLSRKCEQIYAKAPRRGGDGADPEAGNPANELFTLIKDAAALFAPAITGLLGGILQL